MAESGPHHKLHGSQARKGLHRARWGVHLVFTSFCCRRMIDKSRLPNMLTWARIAAIPLMVFAYYTLGVPGQWLAGILFIAACITDYFDGHLARLWSVQSSFGRLLDPIADKVLVAAALLILVHRQEAPLVPSLVIISREILVSGLREFLAEKRIPMPVSMLAKTKTGMQMTAISVLLLANVMDALLFDLTGGWGIEIMPVHFLGNTLLWIAAGLTLITGYHYWRAGADHIN